MWAYFCWLQKSWVCLLILKTMPSCPGLTPMLHFIIGLTAGSVEHSPLHHERLPAADISTSRKRLSPSLQIPSTAIICDVFIWWHLSTLKWAGATRCTLTLDIMWLLILILTCFNDYVALHLYCITGFVSSRMKAFKLQMVAQTPATATPSSNYYLGPLDQISSIWGLGEYVASPI